MTMEGGAGVVPVMDLNRNNYGDGFGYGGGAWFMLDHRTVCLDGRMG